MVTRVLEAPGMFQQVGTGGLAQWETPGTTTTRYQLTAPGNTSLTNT